MAKHNFIAITPRKPTNLVIGAEVVDGLAEDGDPQLLADKLDELEVLAEPAQAGPRLPTRHDGWVWGRRAIRGRCTDLIISRECMGETIGQVLFSEFKAWLHSDSEEALVQSVIIAGQRLPIVASFVEMASNDRGEVKHHGIQNHLQSKE
jgi:hypothetical protein